MHLKYVEVTYKSQILHFHSKVELSCTYDSKFVLFTVSSYFDIMVGLWTVRLFF